MWIRSSQTKRTDVCVCVCVYVICVQCVSELSVIVACFSCRMKTAVVLSLRSIVLHEIVSRLKLQMKETTSRRNNIGAVCTNQRIWVLLVCFAHRHRDAIFRRVLYSRSSPSSSLFIIHTYTRARSSLCQPTPLHRVHFTFSQLQRLPNIQDQHIFRTFWLTKKYALQFFIALCL